MTRGESIDLRALVVLVDVLAAGVRAGTAPIDNWSRAAEASSNATIEAEVVTITTAQLRGSTFADGLSRWSLTSDHRRSIATVWSVCATTGADLAGSLDALAEGLRSEVRHGDERATLCAQAIASARVMVALPVICVSAMLVFDVSTRRFLVSGAGLVCVVAASTLDALAALWMRSLIRSAR